MDRDIPLSEASKSGNVYRDVEIVHGEHQTDGLSLVVFDHIKSEKWKQGDMCTRVNALLSHAPIPLTISDGLNLYEIDGIKPHPHYHDWLIYHIRGDSPQNWIQIPAYTSFVMSLYPDENFMRRWKRYKEDFKTW